MKNKIEIRALNHDETLAVMNVEKFDLLTSSSAGALSRPPPPLRPKVRVPSAAPALI
ncbi:hypothetical protein [Desulfatiglans anilini]|uniref:hypothetical protein n=1 Tax=Desulfatiglans anilini TaxID=90728 RepID=UPI00129476D1|nr:hypothetical protein [Desulfatiglans anilini]